MNYSAYDTNGIVGPVEVDTTRTLGRGATASVYVAKLAGQEFAAKIYHNDYLMDFAKIWAMLANPPTNVRLQFAGEQYPQLAWPSAVLGDTNKRSIGYLMPLVDMSKAFSMDHYYDQILVKKLGSPSELALSYKLEIGRNLTLLLADLHDHGHYFIDMKPQNINVLRGSHVVTLLDCDGFSITGADGKRFPAALVSTDYISPEAFKNSSNPESLGEGQDRYALAVILFQLLTRGTHPFQGIIKSPGINANTNDEKAAMGLYPHGITPDPRIEPRLQSTYFLLDDKLRSLFDRAFVGRLESRPSAREWANCLDQILKEKTLARCEKVPSDIDHIRFMGKQCPACYLAEINSAVKNVKTTKPSAAKLEPESSDQAITYRSSSVPPTSGLPKGASNDASFGFMKIFLAIFIIFSLSIYFGGKISAPSDPIPSTPQTRQEIDNYELGRAAFNANDFSKAFEFWSKAAALGDARAQNQIGNMYAYGIGVTKDPKNAFYWWGKAADQGEGYAQRNLGLAYSEGVGVTKDFTKAAEWLKRSASQGNAEGQLAFGYAYSNGEGVPKDLSLAISWVRKSAEQGYAPAQFALGRSYIDGLGSALLPDDAMAVQWLQKGASQGNSDCQTSLARMYMLGRGIEKDPILAVQLWQKAADQGNDVAQSNLAIIYSKGEFLHKDDAKAAELWKASSAKGNTNAKKNLAEAYIDGRGVSKDSAKGIQLLKEIGEQGGVSAYTSIGWTYMTGRGNIAKNYDLAMMWNAKAAELGDGEGASNVGLLYENGWGVPRDFTKAAEWYKKAISLNAYSGQAEVQLGKLYLSGWGGEKSNEQARGLFSKVVNEMPTAQDEYKSMARQLLTSK